jgi:hypothetical protein
MAAGSSVGTSSAAPRRASAPTGSLVLAVDQVEEVFTACRDDEERTAFIVELVRAAHGQRRWIVVVAIRVDYYYAASATLLAAHHVLVTPIRRDGLRRALEHLRFRRAYASTPIWLTRWWQTTKHEPGALPATLLSTARLELCSGVTGAACATRPTSRGRRARRGRATRGAGVRQFDSAQQAVARSVLMRLAGEGDADEIVRWRVPAAGSGRGGRTAAHAL